MELSKKTTILFTEDLYERLAGLARQRRVSVGFLVRDACVNQYGLHTPEDRLDAVRELGELSLPVGTAEEMAAESVPTPEELMP